MDSHSSLQGVGACQSHAVLTNAAIWVVIVGNVALFAVKLWAGVVSHSVALQADAWHTLTDTFSSLIVLAGVRLAVRPPDARHPFGHGRYELVASMLVGMMLAAVACYFAAESLDGLFHRQSAQFGTLAIVVTAAGAVIKEVMARVAFHAARRSGNMALRADGWHHRSDALSSLVILLGIALEGWAWWMDGVLGLAVALFIALVAYRTVRTTASAIVGERPPAELAEAIVQRVGTLYPDDDLQLHDFRWHNYVRRQELTLHITLPPQMTVREAGIIIAHIERELARDFGLEVTVHVEPRTTEVL